MSEATKRLRRKDLREPDEFFTVTGRVLDWSKKNTPIVAGIGIAAAVVLLAIGIWTWVTQSRIARSSRDFYAANELFKRSQWDAAEKSFADLSNDLPSTPYGRLAKLYAGRAALRANKNAEAANYLTEFLANPPPDQALEQMARINLGAALAGQGQADGARDQLTRAVDINGPARGEAILALAHLEDEAGATQKAIDLYQRYLTDEPDGVAHDLARARILALGGTPPAPAPRMAPNAPQIMVQ